VVAQLIWAGRNANPLGKTCTGRFIAPENTWSPERLKTLRNRDRPIDIDLTRGWGPWETLEVA
jgi:hypothetical protein